MVQSPSEMKHIQVPGECIRYCLDALGVPLSSMATITANVPGRDFAPDIMRGKFSRDISGGVRAIPSHHLAHAYSAWWPSGMDDALILVADGSGSTECAPSGHWKTESYTLYTARDGRLKHLHQERVQAHLASLSTLGFLYEYISRKAGFETRIGTNIRFAEAGKLMGLAAFGGPQPHWHRWLEHIARVGPKLGDVVRTPGGWLERLLHIGVLRLEATRPVRETAPVPDTPDIVEQATKTTPNCLSSYLG